MDKKVFGKNVQVFLTKDKYIEIKKKMLDQGDTWQTFLEKAIDTHLQQYGKHDKIKG